MELFAGVGGFRGGLNHVGLKDGKIYTVKVKADCNLIYPLKNVREIDFVSEKYFFNDSQIEK